MLLTIFRNEANDLRASFSDLQLAAVVGVGEGALFAAAEGSKPQRHTSLAANW